MPYTPNNNPYVPGDPYAYDLKYFLDKIRTTESTAAAANTAASNAVNTANSAASVAASAQSAATNAVNAANSAVNTANSAVNTAGNAVTAAQAAQAAAEALSAASMVIYEFSITGNTITPVDTVTASWIRNLILNATSGNAIFRFIDGMAGDGYLPSGTFSSVASFHKYNNDEAMFDGTYTAVRSSDLLLTAYVIDVAADIGGSPYFNGTIVLRKNL